MTRQNNLYLIKNIQSQSNNGNGYAIRYKLPVMAKSDKKKTVKKPAAKKPARGKKTAEKKSTDETLQAWEREEAIGTESPGVTDDAGEDKEEE